MSHLTPYLIIFIHCPTFLYTLLYQTDLTYYMLTSNNNTSGGTLTVCTMLYKAKRAESIMDSARFFYM